MSTYEQLKKIIENHQIELIEKLGVSKAYLFIPTDGKGLRIHASIPEDEGEAGTQTIEWEFTDEEPVTIKVEKVQDFKPIKPQDKENEDTP